MSLSTGQVFLNRYRVVNRLRQGGMGAVYRAWDMHLNKPVALKENLELGLEAREQFNREATILASLSHPNLPRVTDHFVLEKQGQYLVMDFIEGEDLESMVERLGPISEDTAVGWFLQISSALDYLHRQPAPIIHRDIKPANIKITPEGRAILVDFGIAKFYGHDRVTMDGAKAVTPGFSPLEQYHASTDRRSDIYSLGSTLYTVVTGELIPESTRLALGEATLIPPRQIQPDLSQALEAVILKSVEIHPEQRYQSASELLQALKETFHKSTQLPATAPEQALPLPAPTSLTPPVAAASEAGASKPARPGKSIRSSLTIVVLVFSISTLCVIGFISALMLNNRTSEVDGVPSSSAVAGFATLTHQAIAHTQPVNLPSPIGSLLPPQTTTRPTLFPIPIASIPTEISPGTPPTALLTLDRNTNCRGGTDRVYDIIRMLEQGAQLAIIGKSENQWWLVRLDDPNTERKQCWVNGGLPSGDLAAVPYSDWTGTAETAKTPWP